MKALSKIILLFTMMFVMLFSVSGFAQTSQNISFKERIQNIQQDANIQ